jgi:hypothetical protein
MKAIRYNEEKDAWLRAERGIGFEDIINAVQLGGTLAILNHPNKKRFPKQRFLIVNINNYAYAVPYVENENEIFLKTIYPSRKHTKRYLKNK